MGLGDVGGDNGVFGGCSLGQHGGTEPVIVNLADLVLRQLFEVGLGEVSRNGGDRRNRGRHGGGRRV